MITTMATVWESLKRSGCHTRTRTHVHRCIGSAFTVAAHPHSFSHFLLESWQRSCLLCFMLNVQTYYCNTMLGRVLIDILRICLPPSPLPLAAVVVVVVSTACWNIQTKMLWKYELMLIDCEIWSSWGFAAETDTHTERERERGEIGGKRGGGRDVCVACTHLHGV